MSRRRALAAAGLVTFASAFLAAPLGVEGQETARASAGWWSRNLAQSAPQDGFAVASAPDGPVTVSAVVVDVSGTITSGTFSAVEVGGLGQQDAAIVVCPAAGPVSLPAEGGGDLADAPEADCERGTAPFERDGDARQWTADISGLVGDLGGEVALVVVPAASDAPVHPTFEVRLAAPEVDLRTTAADTVPDRSAPSPSPGPVSEPPPRRTPVSFGSGLPAGSPSPSPQARFDAPDPVGPPATPIPPAAPEPPADDVQEETAMPVRPTTVISSERGPQVGKAVAYVLVSALAGGLVAAAGRVADKRQLRH